VDLLDEQGLVDLLRGVDGDPGQRCSG
jgi:hypothetical protein